MRVSGRKQKTSRWFYKGYLHVNADTLLTADIDEGGLVVAIDSRTGPLTDPIPISKVEFAPGESWSI